jgi:uncharacterized Zn finger protein
VLPERPELAGVLRVAEGGLTAEGPNGELAEAMGEAELALEAATVAFHRMPSLVAYERVQELGGKPWPGMREDLLADLRGASGYAWFHAQLDAFLQEGLLDDAIATVEKGVSYDLLEQMMDAVVAYRPEWAIRVAQQQGEGIIEAW